MATPESAREKMQTDLDSLLGQLAMLAKTLLQRNGEFFPFGATIGSRGKFALVTPVPEADSPTAHDVLDAVLAEIAATKSSIRACGIVAMASTDAGTDAVRIQMEHAEGSSLVIALPYARTASGGLTFGTMEAHRTKPDVWESVSPNPPRPPSKPSTRAAATPPLTLDFDLPADPPQRPERAHSKRTTLRPQPA